MFRNLFPDKVLSCVFECAPPASAVVSDAECQAVPLKFEVTNVGLANLCGIEGIFEVVNHHAILRLKCVGPIVRGVSRIRLCPLLDGTVSATVSACGKRRPIAADQLNGHMARVVEHDDAGRLAWLACPFPAAGPSIEISFQEPANSFCKSAAVSPADAAGIQHAANSAKRFNPGRIMAFRLSRLNKLMRLPRSLANVLIVFSRVHVNNV